MVKNLPSVWETWVLSLGREDPLEKEMATHSTILAWRIPWTESTVAWWTTVHGVAESDTTKQLTHTQTHGVAKSQTRLSDLTFTFNFHMMN